MRVSGIATKILAVILHFLNIKNIELWLMCAYTKWWPMIMRMFI